MKVLNATIASLVLAVGVSTASAQDRPGGASAQPSSPGQAAVDRTAAAGKYLFLFFWREQNAATDDAWKAVQESVAKWPKKAEAVSLQVDDPAEKPLVKHYGAGRAPMPLVLAVAPCGAVTKAFTKKFDEGQLRQAFVSRCTALSMKSLQARKLVLLCVRPKTAKIQQVSLQQGVKDFVADDEYAGCTDVIPLDASDAAEAAFLKDLGVDSKTTVPVTVLIAPPAAVVAVLKGDATKEQLVGKLKAAQSSCCPGGKCGPGGCCPAK